MDHALNRLSRQLCAALEAALAGRKVQPPEAGRIFWNTFQRLSVTRSYHAAGPNPIQPSEIETFCRITRTPLEPHHIMILMAMDRAWIDQAYAGQKARDKGIKSLPPVSTRPISAGILDAMMG